MTQIVALGHSHLPGLFSAFQERSADVYYSLTAFDFFNRERPWQLLVNENYRLYYNPAYIDEVRAFLGVTAADVVLFMLQGEQAFLHGLVRSEPKYEFFLPGENEPRLQLSYPIRPLDLIVEVFIRQELYVIDDFISSLSLGSTIRCYAVSPPPPSGDQEFVLNHVLKYVSGYAADGPVREFGVPSARWRGKIWKAMVLALEAIYTRHRIGFIHAPEASFDSDSCLSREYSSDAIHANSAYYHLVLDQIEKIIES